MDIRVIGRGSNGFVIFPSIDRLPNMASKISSKSTLEEELQSINLLPENGPYKIKKDSQIKRIPDVLKEIFPGSEKTPEQYYMNIPFIDGKILEDYFSDDGIFLGSLEEIHHHLKLLLTLREEIENMNRGFGIKHGDIQDVNIMYSEKDDKMYLIDFGLTRVINNEDEEGQDDDLDSFDFNIIKKYLKYLVNTKIGNKWIVGNHICHFSKDINDFNVFEYEGDFLKGVKYDKVDFIRYHPDRDRIIDRINRMLKDKPTYERDEEIHYVLCYPYERPSYDIDDINIDNMKLALNQ